MYVTKERSRKLAPKHSIGRRYQTLLELENKDRAYTLQNNSKRHREAQRWQTITDYARNKIIKNTRF